MKVSVCITVLNEEDSIVRLLDALFKQSLKPDEIIIVDGGSIDSTVALIESYQKINKKLKVKLLKERSSRSKGRNLSIEIAKNNVVAITDAGCVPQKDWLKNIVRPFQNKADVSVGFYKMSYKNSFQKAESLYLGVLPKNFDANFLPSTRSVAFTKKVWEEVGGFPENLGGTAEDTVFNLKLLNNNSHLSRVKNAVVEWGMPKNLSEFYLKIFNYAKGDAETRIIFFPGKGFMSHNIKALFVITRYLVAIWVSILLLPYNLSPIILVLIFVYCFWAYRKLFKAFEENKTAIWGPVLQITADLGVIFGFINGFAAKKIRK